jgi:hypothetical protein
MAASTPRTDPESRRLDEDRRREVNWKRWGPYLAERQWGTVREDALFSEYFHGDTGRGLGASHQTGWTALVLRCIEDVAAARVGGEKQTRPDDEDRRDHRVMRARGGVASPAASERGATVADAPASNAPMTPSPPPRRSS